MGSLLSFSLPQTQFASTFSYYSKEDDIFILCCGLMIGPPPPNSYVEIPTPKGDGMRTQGL